MTRAFTISFDFSGRTYLALASVRKQNDEEISYSIRVFDDTLHRILPEGSISYSSSRPLCPHSLRHPQALKLFTSISDAVQCHMSAGQIQ